MQNALQAVVFCDIIQTNERTTATHRSFEKNCPQEKKERETDEG